MVKRDITTELIEAAGEYPVVTIFGPRQSGKTTLVQMTFPEKMYYSLEEPDVRIAAETDPRGFLTKLPEGGVLDEIQRLPGLLSYIQGIVDQKKKTGMFILTGSHQPGLHQSVSQSLAGRTAVLTLLPFSLSELRNYRKNWEPFELIVKGAYPRVHDKDLKPSRFFNGYMQTYIERDVRALINLKDLRSFQQFFTLLAGRIGQVVNYTSLSNDVGVSATTIKNWISVLKASFVVFELSPFFENIRKRVVKSPKIYFSDVGLATYLLGIETSEQVSRDPLRGGLYENLLILEILKSRLNYGKRPELFFYRDTHGNEVDLIIRATRNLIPFEIKSAVTFTPDFLKGIEHFREIAGDRCSKGYVLYNGHDEYTLKGIRIFNPLAHEGLEACLL
ncbi:MAG: AAA family ATPase [Deltaproteobacteria bacterium]|nr:MAG: AAA family ATPase [Deltaproteobacteria bacterium]